MSFNTFGKFFRFTTWGESHGPAIGCVVDGCPPNVALKQEDIQRELNKGNQDNLSLLRKEKRTIKSRYCLVFLKVKQQGPQYH